ncbi:hypothetical protein [Neobacillus drentensis]|uniref:hypothetical protein n=1 Tax=Neobacillus drentensis TaxID=220684 RepID=UPI003B58984B
MQDGTLASKEAQIKSDTSKDENTEPVNINVSIPTTTNTTNEALNIVIHAGNKYIGNSVYVLAGEEIL